MILRELFYFDKDTLDTVQDDSYEPQYDQSVVKSDDTRKTKLTLSQINRARKGAETHKKEKSKELDITRQMYGLAAQAAAAAQLPGVHLLLLGLLSFASARHDGARSACRPPPASPGRPAGRARAAVGAER